MTYPNGKVTVKAQPNGDPKPMPLYLDLNGAGELANRIRGDVTAEHLQLLASSNLLGSDTDALREIIDKDLEKLSALLWLWKIRRARFTSRPLRMSISTLMTTSVA